MKDWEVKQCNKENLEHYIDIWNKAERKMVLVGVNPPNAIEQKYLELLAADDTVIVFTETTSNIYHESFFPSIDKIIAPLTASEFEKLKPEVLLSFGGLIVSKKVKAFLRSYTPEHHWHIDDKKANNTFFCLDKHFECDPNDILEDLLSTPAPENGSYKPYWNAVKAMRAKKHRSYLDRIGYSDLKVFETVLGSLPDHTYMHSANSSAIRYLQLFDLNPTVNVFCNRGTSGIDGSTSTAIWWSCSNRESNGFYHWRFKLFLRQ